MANQRFNYITGKWEDDNGGFYSGTGSSSNPIDLGTATIGGSRTSTASSNNNNEIWGQLIGIIPGVVGALTGNQQPPAPPPYQPGYPQPPYQQPQKDNTLLYLGIGAAVLLALVMFMKK